jgi:ribosomal protein L4
MEKIVKKIEDIENPIDNIFKDNVDKKKRSIGLIHRAYLTQIKNSRKYLASTKTKSEVRGGGKKTLETKRNWKCKSRFISITIMERWGS